MYAVFRTQKFDREFDKQFTNEEQQQVENFEKRQLIENPYVGDSLGYRFFREKRVGGKRVYYQVYEDLKAALMVAISDKKTQQETIDEIKSRLQDYYLVVQEILKQHDGSGHA